MADWMARATIALPTLADPSASHADAATVRCWRIRYPNGAAMDVMFHPPATRADVAAIYPGARLEPLPDAPNRQATPAEAAKLHELVNMILVDAPEAERAEALRVACADADAALSSFRRSAIANSETGRGEGARFSATHLGTARPIRVDRDQ